MSKFGAVQRQLEEAAGRKAVTVIAPVERLPAREPSVAPSKAPSRAGKTHIGGYLHPDFKKSLLLVRAQTGEDVQTLLAKALNDLFRAHNVPVIKDD
jgi:hypothetical protein